MPLNGQGPKEEAEEFEEKYWRNPPNGLNASRKEAGTFLISPFLQFFLFPTDCGKQHDFVAVAVPQ